MSNYINGVEYRDLYNLAAVTTGAAINHTEEGFRDIAIAGGVLLGAPYALKLGKVAIWDTPKFAIQNYGNYGPALKNLYNGTIGQTNLYAANRAALKGNFWNTVNHTAAAQRLGSLGLNTPSLEALTKEANRLSARAKVVAKHEGDGTLLSIKRGIARIKNNRALISNASTQATVKIYNDLNIPKLMEEAKGLTGKELTAKMKEIEAAKTQANILINDAKAAGTIKRSTGLGRACSWVKTKSGARAVQNAVNKGTLSANATVRTLSKGVKAGGAMAAISMAMEVPTIAEGFKHDKKTGWKQVGYSTATVAAETAGYVVGAKVGGIAGAKIGATIGTCIGGPIGTAIGGVVGTIIGVGAGLLCSWFAGKAAKKVLGKSPVEKAKENDAKQLADAASQDKESQIALAQAASEKIQNGEVVSEADANTAIESIERVATGVETEIQQAEQAQLAQQAQSAQNPYSTTDTSSVPQRFAQLSALANGTGFTSSSNTGFGSQSYTNPFMSNQYMMNPYMVNPFMANQFGFQQFANPFMANPFGYQQIYNPVTQLLPNSLIYNNQGFNPFLFNPFVNQNNMSFMA